MKPLRAGARSNLDQSLMRMVIVKQYAASCRVRAFLLLIGALAVENGSICSALASPGPLEGERSRPAVVAVGLAKAPESLSLKKPSAGRNLDQPSCKPMSITTACRTNGNFKTSSIQRIMQTVRRISMATATPIWKSISTVLHHNVCMSSQTIMASFGTFPKNSWTASFDWQFELKACNSSNKNASQECDGSDSD